MVIANRSLRGSCIVGLSNIHVIDRPFPLHHSMSVSVSLLDWYRSIDVNISPVQSSARSYHSFSLLLLVLPGHVLEVFYLALGTRQHAHR